MATSAQSKGFGFELTGVKELTRLLDQLPTVAMRKTVVRNALKKAGQPIVDAAKATVPVDDGYLRDSLQVSTKLKDSQKPKGRRDRTTVTVYVGSSAPHAHLVEFGTVERKLETPRVAKIKHAFAIITTTGTMSKTPFLRNAWEAMKGTALKIFAEEMKNELYKSARRLAKRAETGKLTKTQTRGLMK